MTEARAHTYDAAGVDTESAEHGLQRILARLRHTWPISGAPGQVQLDFGYFANVIDIGGIGLAISTDGVGSKVLIAQMMDKYDTIGIDCVAMNVNDILCVGATPISLVDYIAVEKANPELLDEISKGLAVGAETASISITGGEIAQMGDVIQGIRPGYAFDLAGTAVGRVALDRIIVGRDLEPGDAIIGIESNGIHSNGLSLARKVLFEDNPFGVQSRLPELSRPLGEELLRPTHIYVSEIVDLLAQQIPVKAMAHITSDGLLNLTRVAAQVGFSIDELPECPGIFAAIQEYGHVPIEEMFQVYNMGIGFCVIVPEASAAPTIATISQHGKRAFRLGSVIHDPERQVHLRQLGLIGQGKHFAPLR
ncbi:MAG: phosphoribosylformylglycinamidine cyclo-ligase [Chloroflexi bacterium]|nr:phosphoribosylformylglycinamidine cyclo-ligase [Chloroflexota bacterium]